MNSKLDIAFKEAFKKISEMEKDLPPDILLRLYAYYKQAIKEEHPNFSKEKGSDYEDMRNAFKLNALIQLKGMSEQEAKQEYINLTNIILK